MKTILFAIGNNGRQDDGLGWEFGESLERSGDFGGDFHYRYQLQVEDSELVSRVDKVIFVDAFKGKLSDGYQWKKVEPSADFEFTTHALSPEAVLFLCEKLYDKRPEAHCLLIEGKVWELGCGLSEKAKKNLAEAGAYFRAIHFVE